jgi:hypothetical protein
VLFFNVRRLDVIDGGCNLSLDTIHYIKSREGWGWKYAFTIGEGRDWYHSIAHDK